MTALIQPIPIKPPTESRTIRQALIWGTTYLQAEGLPDPRLSAELLLGSVLGLDQTGLLIFFDRALKECEQASFAEKVCRRARHEPIAYLTGQKEFWSLNFEVDSNVLIPRPETELLVEEALKILSDRPENQTLVELGTGSGAVAVSLAKSTPHRRSPHLLATDFFGPALQIARKNAGHHGVDRIISFIQGEWLTPFTSRRQWIDLLVSNPPYIAEAEFFALPTTVKNYEPRKALLGGPDGLRDIKAIIQQAGQQLKAGGWLLLEIGESQGSRVLKLARENRFDPALILKDYAGRDRLLKACYHG
jgi:release factor glutamine methyltransferase